jgi:hypothetical protein
VSNKAPAAAIVVGLAAGYVAYKATAVPKLDGDLCKRLAAAGGTQTFLESLKGLLSHPGEDAALTFGAVIDRVGSWQTAGLLSSSAAADIYAWWEGLSPEDRKKAQDAEAQGLLGCALQETGQQIVNATEALALGLAAGLVAYVAATSFLED